jgi:effector-binding domain-containing protein
MVDDIPYRRQLIVSIKTPEPSWTLIKKEGNIEVRDYNAMIAAEVTTTGARYEAINAGFRILAGYIFGGNTAQEKIAMTAPVIQEANDSQSVKIAMTAPVMQEISENHNEWKVRFIMPPEYTLASLPIANDSHIKFLEMPACRTAVIRFSGFNTDSNLNKHLTILMNWLNKNNIAPIGQPTYAFYNPPWTLPFLKRNEVIIKMAK